MGWMFNATLLPIYPRERDPVSIVYEAGWATGPVWTGTENLIPPPGFDPRTVQPVASRYTDCAIGTYFIRIYTKKNLEKFSVLVTYNLLSYQHTIVSFISHKSNNLATWQIGRQLRNFLRTCAEFIFVTFRLKKTAGMSYWARLCSAFMLLIQIQQDYFPESFAAPVLSLLFTGDYH
jgi:hypothetical protein